MPLLVEAERARHRPLTAVALADCYLSLGELIGAADLYRGVAAEAPARTWTAADRGAAKEAKIKAGELDALLPTVRFERPEPYEELVVTIDDELVKDLSAPRQLPPDTPVVLIARAKGRSELRETLTLRERERRAVILRLPLLAPPPPPPPPPPKVWIGARYRGAILPKFVMSAFAEGGTTVVAPGLGITATLPTRGPDVVLSLGWLSYGMGDTPFKPNGTPDTEYEIVSSTLHALTASVDLLWSVPLDASGALSFRFGGGAGLGWMFAGDLRRTQAYPPGGRPGDPYAYLPCAGPNDPRGTFRYCNTLDKDADRYPGYVEPGWFSGGIRPTLFPWLVLPEVGLLWKITPRVALDVDAGISLSGVITSLGVRYGL